MKARDCGLTSS